MQTQKRADSRSKKGVRTHNERLKILICGFGYVGKKYCKMLERKYAVDVYDPYSPDCVKLSKAKLKQLWDFVFICVPTPSGLEGECNISAVKDCIAKFNARTFVIKSTVAIGTTDYLSKTYNKSIVFSPEYCGESGYDNSYAFHTEPAKTPFIVLGGYKLAMQAVYDLLLPIVGPEKKWFFLEPKAAEMVKYMENTFFAVKIAYCNEIYDICQQLGIDWHAAREAWLADPRINPMHTAVFANKRGFAGKCLPKDLMALIKVAHDAGYTPLILDAVFVQNFLLSHKIKCKN